jgi:hypothetical protein
MGEVRERFCACLGLAIPSSQGKVSAPSHAEGDLELF